MRLVAGFGDERSRPCGQRLAARALLGTPQTRSCATGVRRFDRTAFTTRSGSMWAIGCPAVLVRLSCWAYTPTPPRCAPSCVSHAAGQLGYRPAAVVRLIRVQRGAVSATLRCGSCSRRRASRALRHTIPPATRSGRRPHGRRQRHECNAPLSAVMAC
jgi:hypothetical protein